MSFPKLRIIYNVMMCPRIILDRIWQYYHKDEYGWFSKEANYWLEEHITKDMIGFEFGSGRSTLFFCRQCKNLTSVEDSKEWFDIVTNKLKEHNIHNIKRILIEKGKSIGISQRAEFPEYANEISKYPDEHFDFILVDGSDRWNCFKNSIPKIKKGGFLILDNSDSRHLLGFRDYVKGWEHIFLTSGIYGNGTSVWIKPSKRVSHKVD